MNTMRELFDEARIYGRVVIYTMDDGKYSVDITFNTIKHTQLKATSGFGFNCVEEALKSAINSAKQIVDSVSEIKEKLMIKGE